MVKPRAGDIVFVKTSDDDILIEEGSYGIINQILSPERAMGYGLGGRLVEITFNFYTPWRTSKHYVDASGGPVRFIKLSQLRFTGRGKMVPELTGFPTNPKEVKRKVRVFEASLR